MNNTSDLGSALGLSAEQAQEVFPIARSDRRNNKDLFAAFVPEDRQRDDADFYAGLVRMIAGDGLDALRKYDDRMTRAGSKTKTFGFRALRWLSNRATGELSAQEFDALAPDHFPPLSVERSLHQLFLGLLGLLGLTGNDKPDQLPATLAATEAQSGANWAGLARDIAAAAEGMVAPEPGAAEHVLALAEALLDACRLAAQAEARQAGLAARAAQLRDRLMSVSPALIALWPTEPGSDWLDAVETDLTTAEAALSNLHAAEQDLAQQDAAVKAALASLAYGELASLGPRAEVAKAKRDEAKTQEDVARSTLAALFGQDIAQVPLSNGTPEAARIEPKPPEPEAAAHETKAENDSWSDVSPEEDRTLDLDLSPEISITTDATPSSPPAPDSDPEAGFAAAPDTRTDAKSDQDAAPAAGGGAPAPDTFGAPDTGQALAAHLENGDAVFAWHLARLSETAGDPVLVPAPVFQAVTMLRSVHKADDMADTRRSRAMAELSAALPDAADQAAANKLALAALLRPALFDPDYGARAVLGTLHGRPGLELHAPLIEVLAGLGHDIRLSVQTLEDLAGGTRTPQLPHARENLQRKLDELQKSKTNYQPAVNILHRELRSDGRLGTIAEAALTLGHDAPALVSDIVANLGDNRTGQEEWIVQAEQRQGRLGRDRIDGKAKDWLCNRLQEFCDALAEWQEARNQDAAIPQDRNRDKLLRVTGSIRKVLDQTLPATDKDTALVQAADMVLGAGLNDLRAVLDGKVGGPPAVALSRLMEQPMLRLPGGCQAWAETDDPGYSAEIAERDNRRRAALLRPACIAPDTATAFDQRLAETAVLAAHKLLELMRAEGRPEASLREHDQKLAETIEAARRLARDRVERLRQSFTTLGYLDVETTAELPGDLAQLAAIAAALVAAPDGNAVALPAISGIRAPDVPPDFPELDTLLGALETRRDRLRGVIASRQRDALDRLTTGPAAASAKALLDRIDSLDPVTVDDAIAELNAGREVPLPKPDAPDAFMRFYPSFVAALEAAPEDTKRGKVHQAAQDRRQAGPMDFATSESRSTGRLIQLLESWGAAENAMRQSQPPKLRDSLAQVFGQIGLTGVRITEGRESIPGRLRSYVLDCDVPRPSGWFLPPAFGSATAGRYRLLIARSEVSRDQILRQLGSEAPDAAWIVIFFGRFGVQDRLALARQLRAEGRQALVLDETLLMFMGYDGEDALSVFFACTLPFAWVQPYTTSAGQIPPEVFFGRRAEIERILARDGGGCLIYGGRQLGKSALLTHIRGERHRPDIGELAIYLDIKPIGGVGILPDTIWEELAHELRPFAGFAKVEAQPNALVAAIRGWLEADPSRRLIAMFDEADNFLRAEHAGGYPNLQRLKGLMEGTGRRFKAVFAGLHNVRRMARAPNSPLPHLGEPICVGPMNLSPENRAALRQLAVQPIRAAGLDYADPALASDMLARMNYYPSLVQVFGRQIVESFGRRPAVGAQGPRWVLDRNNLFEGEAAERIATQIRDRFQLTLNLDLRYECIAKSIALHRLDTAAGDIDVLAQGLTPPDIWQITHWPARLTRPGMADFEELLGEMVDLGVLGKFPGNRFGLRNAQIAQMLGQREGLIDDLLLLDERDDDPAYDAAQYHRLLRPILQQARAPLSDRMIDRLFDTGTPGLRVVVAPALIVGADVAERLRVAAELWMSGTAPVLITPDENALRRVIDKATKTPMVVVIQGPWSADTARHLARQPKVADGRIIPVWCLDTAPQSGGDFALFHAGTWSEAMLRHWLTDEGLTPALDDPETRGAILSASGGAPARLTALRPLLSDLVTRTVVERLARLADWRIANPLPALAFGLTAPDLAPLQALRDFGDQFDSLTALHEFCPEATPDRLTRLKAAALISDGARTDDCPVLTAMGWLVVP